MTYTRSYNKKYNFLAFGLKNGSVLIWDCELHCDKLYIENGNSFQITHLTINENFLMSASVNGKVFINDLNDGCLVYEAYNNPYMNYPITSIIPLDYYINLVLDASNNICLYFCKDKHRICKINFTSSNTKYGIQQMYIPLIQASKDYLVSIGKSPISIKKKNIIELISFQTNENKPVLSDFIDKDWTNWCIDENSKPYKNTNFDIDEMTLFPKDFNFINFKHEIGCSEKSLIFSIKTKEILSKCYPELRGAFKNKIPFKKLLDLYKLKEIPSYYDMPNLINVTSKQNLKEAEPYELNEIKEFDTSLDKENEITKTFHKTDSGAIVLTNTQSKNIFPDSLRDNNRDDKRKQSKLFDKKISSLLSEKEFESLKKGLKSTPKNNSSIIKINKDLSNIEKPDIAQVSEKKNIIYQSFKNIQERFQFREKRDNQFQMFVEKVQKDLILPKINTKSKIK